MANQTKNGDCHILLKTSAIPSWYVIDLSQSEKLSDIKSALECQLFYTQQCNGQLLFGLRPL